MKDVIDERNRREKMQKSIIKYWNVSYAPVTQQTKEPQEMPVEAEAAPAEPENDLAAEVLREQARKRRRVVEEAIEEDTIERGKINKILHEKTDKIQDIVDHKGIL